MNKKVTRKPKDLYADYVSGKSMQEIATIEGVSRERVRQILRRYKPDFVRNDCLKRPRVERITKECANKCGKVLTLLPCKAWIRYCSRECYRRDWVKSPYRTSDPRYPEWKRKHAIKRARFHYWNVLKKKPDHKQIIRERNQKYKKKRHLISPKKKD